MEYFTAHTEERVNNFEMHFDDERPPIYNAEDYAVHLRKYTKMSGTQLYSSVKKARSQSRSDKKSNKNRSVSSFLPNITRPVYCLDQFIGSVKKLLSTFTKNVQLQISKTNPNLFQWKKRIGSRPTAF